MHKYESYGPSYTMAYKQGYIYSATIEGNEVVKYQVDRFAYVQYAKSIHAAKIAITKHAKRVSR